MLRTELREALNIALKSRDKLTIATLRLVLSNLKERDRVQTQEQGKDILSDTDIILMIQSMLKQRQESIKAYQQGNRQDLVEREQDEIAILQRFLPSLMDEDELDAAIEAILQTLRHDGVVIQKSVMGKIMALLKSTYPGQIDLSTAAVRVQSKL